jgi:hypothetical protein
VSVTSWFECASHPIFPRHTRKGDSTQSTMYITDKTPKCRALRTGGLKIVFDQTRNEHAGAASNGHTCPPLAGQKRCLHEGSIARSFAVEFAGSLSLATR